MNGSGEPAAAAPETGGTAEFHLYTIPPGTPFLTALAEGIWERFAGGTDDPGKLADCLVLLPTRRAVRGLTEAFLTLAEARGQPALALPAIRPIGDVEEDALVLEDAGDLVGADPFELPPAMPGLKRQFLLTKLVLRYAALEETALRGLALADAASLAAELARFIDFAAGEGASLAGLEDLAPAPLATHWQNVLVFLRIVTEFWPKQCAELGAIDGAERRDRLLRRLAERYADHPPAGPVIAAGSTGSIPATAKLLGTIARMPQGHVVLPGLDQALDTESWDAVAHGHPQAAMRTLLDHIGARRGDVRLWGKAPGAKSAARAALVGEALRPADTTHHWPRMARRIDLAAATEGLSLLETQNPNEEAALIALLMRESLETPDRTAALVTPDRTLARLVAAELERWGIEIDDSAGAPLSRTKPAVFLRLLLAALESGFAPVALLALLRHPFCRLGLARGELSRRAGQLDRRVLRGTKPAPGLEGLSARLEASDQVKDPAPLADLLARLGEATLPLRRIWADGETGLPELVEALAGAGEALAAGPGDAPPLWADDAGEALAGLLADMAAQGAALDPFAPQAFPRLFEELLGGVTVRPRYGRHPRLHIWGPLEARLQQADLLVLGSLNEGTWPADPGHDPWMSRPMRTSLGLPPPEQRIGLAAHDFAQAANAPRVVLTRATRAEGVPTVASRWLLRLKNILKGANADFPQAERLLDAETPYLAWARALRRPDPARALKPPHPAPPVDARPAELPVTDIERLVRDPYAIYAKRILRLRPLDALEEVPGPATRGTLIHAALDRFVARHPGALPPDAEQTLLALMREELGAEAASRPEIAAFWWPRFARLVRWFLEREAQLRGEGAPAATEVAGSLALNLKGRAFTLTARADRIDRLQDGALAIYDYKTGGAPTPKQVKSGFAPQLPLEAAIASAGGFEGVPGGTVARLAYIRLTGGAEAGEFREISAKAEETGALSREALDTLTRLLLAYQNPDTPYLAKPRPQFRKDPGDYDHLARIAEWSAGGEDGA